MVQVNPESSQVVVEGDLFHGKISFLMDGIHKGIRS